MSTGNTPKERDPAQDVIERTHRYSSEQWCPSWIRLSHTKRYEWAALMATGRRVLDAACGTGYGSRVLRAAGASYVEGVDLSEESIDEARRLHSNQGISFRRCSILDLTTDAPFDLIVSFETVEHIPDDRAYAARMRALLKPGGVFLCSTPNRLVTNPGTTIMHAPYNTYHVREYAASELRRLLLGSFDSVELLGQQGWSPEYIGILARLPACGIRLPVRLHQLAKLGRALFDRPERYEPQSLRPQSEPETLIACCS